MVELRVVWIGKILVVGINESKNRPLLIVGGSGYIGNALCEAALERGETVISLDLKSSSIVHKNLYYEFFDLNNFEGNDLRKFDGMKCYFLAGMSDLNKAISDPNSTIQLNVMALTKFLDVYSRFSTPSFTYFSSVYASGGAGGIYGKSKACAELIISDYADRNKGFIYNIFRLGSVYGGRSDETNGLHRIVERALNGEEIWYFGPSDAERSYVHISDVVSVCFDQGIQLDDNEIFMVKGHDTLKIEKVCLILEEILGLPKRNRIMNEKYDGHYKMTPLRVSKLIRTINASKKIDFDTGLFELCESLRKQNGL